MRELPHDARERTARNPQDVRPHPDGWPGRPRLKARRFVVELVPVNVVARPRPGGRSRTDPFPLLAAVLLALLVPVAAAPAGSAGQIAQLLASTGAAATAWLGARRRALRPGAIPWVSLTLTLNAVADVLDQIVVWTGGSPGDGSPGHLFRTAAYAALTIMLFRQQLGGKRHPGTVLHAALDGTGAMAVALLLVYQTSAAGALAARGHGVLARLAWIGYPVLDAGLIGLVAWRVVLHGRVRRAALLGLAGVSCWLAADVARLLAATGHPPGGWGSAVHTGGAILLATVPWTRSTPADQALAARRPGHGPWRMAINIAPMLAPAVLEVVAWARGTAVNPIPDVLVWGLLLLLTTVRTRVLAVDGERAWEAVHSQARRSEALAVNSSDAVAVVTPEGRLLGDSRSLGRLLGGAATTGDELAGLLAPLGVAPEVVQGALDRTQARRGTPVELELAGRTPEGAPLWLGGRAVDLSADPDVAGIVVSVYDITRRKLAEQELAHQAFHDGLTGLANRSLFLDRAEQALRRAGRSGAAPVVLCLDLDGFKDVNDSLGHPAGDELLQEVAARLRDVVRAADTVARLGGDEFAVLVDDPSGGLPAASELAERLLTVLAQPVRVGGHRVTVAASIGIVPAEPEATPTSLLRDGDIAMYRAKAAGRGRWVVFAPEMRETALERIELERALSTALAAGQLRLVYQPVVDLRDGRTTGVEALLRWRHPQLGAVGPDRFVPVAEASGLIVPIGRWVLEEATRAAARWQGTGPGAPLTMAVNVSPRQLASDTFLDDVAAALAESGIAPASLVLEITETALVTDSDVVAARLAGLRRLGVRIALDDFGTGYSSLSYLRQFPVDVLKIDRSFVELLDGPADDAAIVHGLVQLGHTLELEVVAEGVETAEQAAILRREGCDLAQGYLLSAPLEADEAARAVTADTLLPNGS